MYRNESNYKIYMFFLSCFLQFYGKDVTRLNETTVVFSSPPILEDPENYNITTIILMDHYNLVVKNESHSFAYVADPTFENFTDGIKKQVNKLINAKVNLSRGDGCSVCPWSIYGIFPSLLEPLTAVRYHTQNGWQTSLPLLDNEHCQFPFPPQPLLFRGSCYLFSHTLGFPGMPSPAGPDIWKCPLPQSSQGLERTSHTRKEWNCVIPNHSALLFTAVQITSAAKSDPNGKLQLGT